MSKKNIWMIAALAMVLNACDSENKQTEEAIQLVQVDDLTTSEHPILNGIKDTSREHNAVVSIFLKDAPNYGNASICTGTLIHPSWVLTAAHCVAVQGNGAPKANELSQYIKIGIGNNMNELLDNLYSVDHIFYHTGWGNRAVDGKLTIVNDIALIHLQSPVPETKALPIPPLPPAIPLSRALIQNQGVNAHFVGFGKDEKNNSGVKLKYSSKLVSSCGDANGDSKDGCYYGRVKLNGCHPDKNKCNISSTYAEYCSSGYFCFNDLDFDVMLPHGSLYYEHEPGGTCNGDSGGPALVTFNGTEYIAGITSFGDNACARVGVHTSVQDFYQNFILKLAPEVAEYHEARKNAWGQEVNSGICGPEHVKPCKEKYNNDSCYFTDANGNYICTNKCSNKGDIQSYCQQDSDGIYRTYRNICVEDGGIYKYKFDNTYVEVCDNKCDNTNTACYVDANQQAWDKEIQTGICGEQHRKRCNDTYHYGVNNTACYFASVGDPKYICTTPCTKEGETDTTCVLNNAEAKRYTRVCKNVNGTLMKILDESKTKICQTTCNSEKTDCELTPNEAWDKEEADYVCGPAHVQKCQESWGKQYNACYYTDLIGNYICTTACDENDDTSVRFTTCTTDPLTDESIMHLYFCADTGNGRMVVTSEQTAVVCENGCAPTGDICFIDKTPLIETFDGISPKSPAYTNGIFESRNTDTTWSYLGRTIIEDEAIDGDGIILKTGGYITGLAHNGISTISVDIKKDFASKEEREVALSIDNVPCNSITIGPANGVAKLTCDNVNLSGDVRITISVIGDSVTIDNITWVAF